MKIRSLTQSVLFVSLISTSFVPAMAEETADDWERMVFHLDETANARWALMLSSAYLDDSPKAKLVIVAHGPGIDFLLEGAEDRRGNLYEPAVMNLVARGVEFRVCATTLAARDIDKERLESGELAQTGHRGNRVAAGLKSLEFREFAHRGEIVNLVVAQRQVGQVRQARQGSDIRDRVPS